MKRHLLKAMTLAVGIVLASGSYADSRSCFIENKGQFSDQYGQPRNDINFKLDAGKGLTVFISSTGITYQWLEAQKDHTFKYCRMEAVLLNSNTNAGVTTSGQQPYYERYFLPAINTNNSNKGAIAHSFNKITYHDIYPGIDWVLFLNKDGKLEYEFIVHPGADLKEIQLKYNGVENLQLQADGSLKAVATQGSITEQAPYVYAENGKEIAASFVLNNNILSYQIAPHTGTLIIDPVLEWGTYFGGALDETVAGIATDKWGYVYMAGNTNSTANIATTGSYQGAFAGGNTDAYISKWDSAGTLLWATYYGGTNVDDARGIACDTAGNVLLLGATNSPAGIATTGSYQETKLGTANRYDVFLAKFDSSGARQWGTYFGGTLNDGNTPNSGAVVSDPDNNIYITAVTQSDNLPVSANAYQSVRGGYDDAFIAKFTTQGNLSWCTYHGGEASDFPFGLAIDNNANLYITGYTQSTTGISSTSAYQEINAGGQDAFLAKFDSAGNRLWSTYFGGSGYDVANTISLSINEIAIGGTTNSPSGISSGNAFQSSHSGNDDGFIAVFNLDGDLQWSSYYGGEGWDAVAGLSYNNQNDLYVYGETTSDTGIATTDAFIKSTLDNYSDLFIAKFTAEGARTWATYAGGADYEASGPILAVNANVYLAGATLSANNIAMGNSYQSLLNGGQDAFLIKFDDCYQPSQPGNIEGNISVCSNSQQIYSVANDTNAIAYQWLLPDEWQGNSDSNSISVIAGASSGLIKVIAISACGGISDTQSLAVTVLPSPIPVIVNNNNILATSEAYATYQWIKNNTDIAGATNPTYIPTQNGNYRVRVSSDNGCEGISEAITVSGVSGVAALSPNDGIQLFPNPARGVLNIRATVDGTLSIYTMDGRCVTPETTFSTGVTQIDISGLAQGVYTVRLAIKGQQKVWKLVKQ